MPRPITGIWTAVSHIRRASPAPDVQEQVIDLQLGPRQGIEIFAIWGDIQVPTGAGGVAGVFSAYSTLHAQVPPTQEPFEMMGTASEGTRRDTEIVYRQDLAIRQETRATDGVARDAILTPSDWFQPVVPILVATNMTHRAQLSPGSLALATNHLLYIRYRWVEFSLEELGVILARRF